MPQFTHEQQQAIQSRDGTVLVSAAAGSGKTTVLVERVIQRLESSEKPCSADRLLIVTFTKAATAQMREKIAAALDKRLEQDPENEHLLKQRMLLPFAHISTIDSFCGEIVRENFQALGITPDFKMLEEAQLDLMENDALDTVLENAYAENSPQFQRLLDLFISSSNDAGLSKVILSLYNNSRAFPFPDKWLDSLVEPYENLTCVAQSVFGKIVLEYADDTVDYCLQITKSAISAFLEDDFETAQKYVPVFAAYENYLNTFKQLINGGDWDGICEHCNSFDACRLSSLPKGYSSPFADAAKGVKAEVSDILKKRLPQIFCCSEQEFKEDLDFLCPVAQKLVCLVKAFNDEFNALKTACNGADFNDVVAFAIKLLVKSVSSNGEVEKTKLAHALSLEYDEILIDEFQDINETQNILFKAISKDENNLFMVGDVKQSIYRFRQAMPDIFLNRRKILPDYIENNYPAKINLDFNFRSRIGINEFVNFIFTQLMSEKAGELNYDSSESLKSKAVYPVRDCADTEIHIISNSVDKVERTFEAEYIADYINKTINDGFLITDGDVQRPVDYRDFCILMRATKGKADIYANVLTERGIPCHISSRNGFFEAVEIKTALSIMRCVDNPLQDIPLATAMLSPVFGFTPDELAQLRIDSRKTSYYNCITSAADKGNEKCISFLSTLSRLRNLSVTLGAGEFVREMMEITGYDALVCAMPGGSLRKANLTLLLDYAQKYEQAGHIGLSGFIRFIDKVEKKKGDMEIANEISENANVVKIMSVHKSKGLEFPVCILADTAGKFNDEFLKGNAQFHPKYGIGFKRIESYRRFETLPQKAIQLAQKRSERSEELRVLYVALTRAKERLVLMVRENDPDKKISKLAIGLTRDEKIHPYKVMNSASMGDWILLSSLRHPDFAVSSTVLPCGKLNAVARLEVKKFEGELSQEFLQTDEIIPKIDFELLSLLKERSAYSYPYGNLSDIAIKVSPSSLESKEDMNYFTSSKPSFLLNDGVSSASKGTAMHKFMEFYDYNKDLNVVLQAQEMVKKSKLSRLEEQALDYNALNRFFESDIAEEIKKSSCILREKKVTFTVSAKELYQDISPLAENEPIVVQGYIDCAFLKDGKWVIVDYKTDRVADLDVLKSRYFNQLKMYERALLQCTGKPVDSTVIYSFYLGKWKKI